MIEIKPLLENAFVCPECGMPDPTVSQITFRSIHTMAECACRACGFQFYQTFPVGHSTDKLLSISKTGDAIYPAKAEKWLVDSLRSPRLEENIVIRKVVFRQSKAIIILNTLDFLYGHVLLKLYNSLYHLEHQPDLGLVVIIPAGFEWLIPRECTEAWIVDRKLSELRNWYSGIDQFINAQCERFDRIFLSRAFSHPDVSSVDLSRLTSIKPFQVDRPGGMERQITFVLREDRWWFPTRADYWFYRVCRKMKWLQWGGKILCHRQNGQVKATIRKIRKELDGVMIAVVGLGKTGSFAGYATDQRAETMSAGVEIEWCKTYAKSILVVGVHGSNMLLPTAHAGGCVEILPEDRYGNIVQDISVRYNDRRMLFFYRFADQYSSAQSVAAKIKSTLNDHHSFIRTMCHGDYRNSGISVLAPVPLSHDSGRA